MKTKTITPLMDLVLLLLACFVSSLLIKLPSILNLPQSESDFYQKNGALIVFFGMSLYVLLSKDMLKKSQWMWAGLSFLIPAVFINFLPSCQNNDSVILACLHLALLMWCIYGLIFIHPNKNRMDFVRYNGDLVVLTTIIILAGVLFSLVTIELFNVIGYKIHRFFEEYISVWGLVSTPIVATYILKNYASLSNKIAPLIANIFSPMVLLMLLIFLVSFPFSGKNPFSDREFLLVFNVLLLGVMTLIVFSISETSRNQKKQFSKVILLLMALAALIINVIAITAILYRLGEYGFTPNRTAVLGSNLILFVHLIWIGINLYQVAFKKRAIELVENTVSRYLPVYAIWTIIVVFGFPLIFGVD